jgi:EAL domain-containing protein (putative c-di-GMP-specific phosphodiesterase class I)
MKIITSNIEAKLVDFAQTTRGVPGDNYVLHFHLSRLSAVYRSDFQIKIAVNILNDLFREERGFILKLENQDVFLLYQGSDRNLLGKAVFQLRYLFFDDALANHPDGSENEEFCTIYDLNFDWKLYFQLANEIMASSLHAQEGQGDGHFEGVRLPQPLSPLILSELEKQLDALRIDECVRKQPICRIRGEDDVKPLFQEVYVNISHLEKLLRTNYPLTSSKWLFHYLTERLDQKVIESIEILPDDYLKMPVSLNLNIATVLSKNFAEFCEIVKDFKSQLIIEIAVSDLFTDMQKFYRARDYLEERGHKVLIDGLDNEAFVQLSRKRLGFDLAKLQWNADMKGDLHAKAENQQLRETIVECGENRIILCRCDDIHAIEYGHALGLSLFQGRYPDRLVNPRATIIN